MVKYRTTASAALLAVLGTMFATVPASAAATTPAVRLSGELVQVADQQGAGLAAIRLADGALVPITAESVKDIASGSSITLDVAIPADVRVAAAANWTLTTQGVDGKQIAVRLRSIDLAAASDGSPESRTSAIGEATVAEAMAPGTPALEVSKVVAAAADPVSTFTPATRKLYVAVVTPAGGTLRPSVDQSRIRTQVADASSYWSDVTGGDITLSVETITPQYISAYTCSNYWGMWNEAAAKLGFTSDLPANTSLVIELPPRITQNPQCGYGMGTIGGSPNDSGYLYTSDDVWPVLAHELGHNMSLQHANALLCPTAADSAYSTTTSAWTGTGCWEDGYGDGQDVMSSSPQGFAPFLSAPQSLRTGFIAPSAAAVIDTVGSQNVTLLPLAGGTGVRTAEVVNPTTGVTYYVEYRTAAGRDLRNVYGVKTGVRVLRYNPETGDTVLLDPSPTGQSRDPDPTLAIGQKFLSYDGRVSITTVSANGANAVVSVTTGASPMTAPGAPTVVTATAGDSSAAVSWAAPTSNGGAPVTGYTVTAAPGGRTATTGAAIATVTGLSNGTAYTFTVTATNAIGTSTASAASGAVTPAPGSSVDTTNPVLNSFSLTGSPATPGSAITVSYVATEASGPLQAMIFQFTDPIGGTHQVRADGNVPLTGTISQIIPVTWPNGTYTLTGITAVDPSGNQAGYVAGGTIYKIPSGATGPTSHTLNLNTANFTVAEVPSAPSWVSVSGGNQKADLVWSPASSNGLPITGYTVTASPGGRTVTTTGATAATITGLANGTSYTFTVTATNGIGTSLASTPSTPVIPSPVASQPSQPTAVTATAGDAAGLVSWTAPVSDGGSAITGYTITSSPGGKTAWVSWLATTGTVTGLSNGTAYTFTVSATNTVGTSSASLPSAAVTPRTVPGAPTGVKATAGNAQAVVSWVAPVGDGGSAVTGYTVTAAPGGRTATTGVTNTTVTGLANGTAYTFTVSATNAVGTSLASAASAAVTPMAPMAPVVGFTGKAPTRVLDTRYAVGAPTAKLGAGRTLTLTVPGLPAGTTAVALNVTVAHPTEASYLSVYPGGTALPTASNLNFVAGQAIANMVVVPVGPGNTVTFYNGVGTVNVVADLVGYYAPGTGAGFTGKAPTRVLDTRYAVGAPTAKLGAGRTLTLTVPDLPAGTTAVALNVTVVHPTEASYLSVYPGGTALPTASNLNFVAGRTIANMVLVPVGPGNTVTFYNGVGTVNVVADLVGYYKPGTGAGFTGKAPTRVLDTRYAVGAPTAKLGAGRTLTLTVPDLPAGTTAVALNVTVAHPTEASYLSVYPGGTALPTASNLNFVAGQAIANLVLVPVGPGNTVTFYNGVGTVNVIADLVGYYK